MNQVCYICSGDAVASCHWCVSVQPGLIGRWICDKHTIYVSETINKWADSSLPLSCCTICFKQNSIDQIHTIMLAELRLDYERNAVDKSWMDKIIEVNLEAIKSAATKAYEAIDPKDLRSEPMVRNESNMSDANANLYRDYLYDYLDEDLVD
jgi:hypothetical protein